MNDKMNDLFLSLGTSLITFETTNSFESIVSDFNELQSEWLKLKNQEANLTEFELAVRPLMNYMAKNHHPHTTAIVDSINAQVYESQKTYNTDEFLVD